jgi:hypothetical protein
MDATQSAPSTGPPLTKPTSPPRADIRGSSASATGTPMLEVDADRREETVIIDDDTVSDIRADIAVPDTTGAGNMGAGIETSKTPDTPKSPQQPPPTSQHQAPPKQQQ